MLNKGNISLRDYLNIVKKTDQLPENDLSVVLHGLFGEVGEIMTVAKKKKREPEYFTGFNSAVIEEFGDAFWYLCCLAARLDIDIEKIFLDLAKETDMESNVSFDGENSVITISYQPELIEKFDDIIVCLGKITGEFLSSEYVLDAPREKVFAFLRSYFDTVALLNLDFDQVLSANVEKVSSRFLRPDNSYLPTFDEEFPEFERLPTKFEIEYIRRTRNQQAMRWNGVFIGDPLTDSISEDDGYRFHDVFHFSYAAILHWSPTFRALIKHKRKSKPEIDEAQDGGRAIVVEEGLVAWIFTIAKENNFFKSREKLTFDMLKNVGQIVKGYEAEEFPLILWEEAILKGYEVFRQVMDNQGGVVVGDRDARTIEYRKEL